MTETVEADVKLPRLFVRSTPPLPPLRPTSEITADIDHQIGRLATVRERASVLIKQMESADEQRA